MALRGGLKELSKWAEEKGKSLNLVEYIVEWLVYLVVWIVAFWSDENSVSIHDALE